MFFLRLGIMQPYFVPYLGYWQLMNAVDVYLVYDDVNFIKGGRINRNNILINHEAKPVNLILSGASPNKLINEVVVDRSPVSIRKLIAKIEGAYCKAPYFQDVFPILTETFRQDETDLGRYLFNSFKSIGSYLGITTKLLLSSEIEKDCSLKGKEKVMDICKRLGADEYYNSVGGMHLYDKDEFAEHGITLHFLKMNEDVVYPQFKEPFVPNLSIVDVMMFNSKEKCHELLKEYTLV